MNETEKLDAGKASFWECYRVDACWRVLSPCWAVLGRVAGVLSAKMGKTAKGKAAETSGESWYEKKCRENPNFKAERAEAESCLLYTSPSPRDS